MLVGANAPVLVELMIPNDEAPELETVPVGAVLIDTGRGICISAVVEDVA